MVDYVLRVMLRHQYMHNPEKMLSTIIENIDMPMLKSHSYRTCHIMMVER